MISGEKIQVLNPIGSKSRRHNPNFLNPIFLEIEIICLAKLFRLETMDMGMSTNFIPDPFPEQDHSPKSTLTACPFSRDWYAAFASISALRPSSNPTRGCC